MSKITLESVESGYNLQAINDNFAKLAAALDTEVMYRDNPGTEPNQFFNEQDMNSYKVTNLGDAVDDADAVNLGQVIALLSGVQGSNPFLLRAGDITDGDFTFGSVTGDLFTVLNSTFADLGNRAGMGYSGVYNVTGDALSAQLGYDGTDVLTTTADGTDHDSGTAYHQGYLLGNAEGKITNGFYIVGDSLAAPNGGDNGAGTFDTNVAGDIINVTLTVPGTLYGRDFIYLLRDGDERAYVNVVTNTNGTIASLTLAPGSQTGPFTPSQTGVAINLDSNGIASWAFQLRNSYAMEGVIDAANNQSVAGGNDYKYAAPPASGSANIAIIDLGSNDALAAVPQLTYETAYEALIQNFLDDGYRVICRLPPQNDLWDVSDYRQYTRNAAAAKGVTEVWDVPTHNYQDGVHPTQQGQEIIKRDYYTRLVPAGSDTSASGDPTFGTVTADNFQISGYIGGPGGVGSSMNTFGIDTTGIQSDVFLARDLGTAAFPAYSFAGDDDTGIWSSTAGALDFATNGVNRATLSAFGWAMLVSMDMGGNKIQSLGAPTLATDAANKAYVDAAIGGGGTVAWGGISGTLSDQADLQSALDAKLNLSGGVLTGRLGAVAGTEALPGIYFDNDTGFYQTVAGEIALGINASRIASFNTFGVNFDLPLSMGTNAIINVADPTDAQDAATKAYVDGSGISDHGALSGLGDDDHTQYLRTDGSRDGIGNQAWISSLDVDRHLTTGNLIGRTRLSTLNGSGTFSILQLDNAGSFEKTYAIAERNGGWTFNYNGLIKLQTTTNGVSVTGDVNATGAGYFGPAIVGGFAGEAAFGSSAGVPFQTLGLAGRLMYDNAEKLITTLAGVTVTGELTTGSIASSGQLSLSNSAPRVELQESDVVDKDVWMVLDTGLLQFQHRNDAGGFLGSALSVDPTGATTLMHNKAAKLATSATGVTVTGDATATNFLSGNALFGTFGGAAVMGLSTGFSLSATNVLVQALYSGAVKFATAANGIDVTGVVKADNTSVVSANIKGTGTVSVQGQKGPTSITSIVRTSGQAVGWYDITLNTAVVNGATKGIVKIFPTAGGRSATTAWVSSTVLRVVMQLDTGSEGAIDVDFGLEIMDLN